ncbi:unnamed protein product [Paramecium sonneborni]|uniref:Transmembrane protein n=1 Tax=Paramecium sonneborni TaxID=65129 RepID=A0A8S1R687_9CILI|nr:unnamed protein product [Paramecium sonneborni]
MQSMLYQYIQSLNPQQKQVKQFHSLVQQIIYEGFLINTNQYLNELQQFNIQIESSTLVFACCFLFSYIVSINTTTQLNAIFLLINVFYIILLCIHSKLFLLIKVFAKQGKCTLVLQTR